MPEATSTMAQPQVGEFSWGDPELALTFGVGPDGVVRLTALGPLTAPAAADAPGVAAHSLDTHSLDTHSVKAHGGVPVVEVQLAGSGRSWSGERSIETATGGRLAYQAHEQGRDGRWTWLRIDLADPDTGLAAQVHYRCPDGAAAVQCRVRLTNTGAQSLVVQAVTSFAVSGLTDPAPGNTDVLNTGDLLAGLDLAWADSDWLAEGRWQRRPLRDLLVDLNRGAHQHDPRGCFSRCGQGSWSTGRYLPCGALLSGSGGALLWQVESPGGWRWEVGERAEGAYLALLGPGDRDHQWRAILRPGGSFESVPAAVAVGRADAGRDAFTAAVAAMTGYRRALRRAHPDHAALPVVYNDYMNTLMGDPTTERLLPLVDAAADAGAECFVIDAGWYDDDAGGWWDSVGAWREARSRFPGGLGEVLGRIRARGMTAGLWLEPEVVGVRSEVAALLPQEAFFQRDGVRLVEHGRHHLDLRHPAARAHLDAVVDRLVTEYGVGYFKLDYNIDPGPGTDAGGAGAGAGLLGHQRAYLDWLGAVLDRHPGLTLENCASGAMRADYALLSVAQIQSTSDQQDFLRYPPIAAAAPAAIAPEQAAVWAYPQPEFSDDHIAFALAGALLGRPYLSGHLDRMTGSQRALVADAVAVYKSIRADLPQATPLWPLGLPGWTDPWFALGQRAARTTYVTVWHRDDPADETRVLPLPHLRSHASTARLLFPSDAPDTHVHWDPAAGALTVRLPRPGTSCLIAVDHPAPAQP